ncbi:MAG: aspartyl/glutamyl-tRNA(Asn/Gln) amidotransferase subunit C [Chitinophagales bacterium]|nr:MAG: aspartyl/glutamyl-tRNA(Asn/Gln) amidotransferase subunit C [Chitinophagales bacterium]
MQITDQLFDKIARLAKLEFSEEERKVIIQDMTAILAMMEKLNEVDVSQTDPLVYITEEVNPLRKDQATAGLSRDEVFRNAPLHDGVFFKVPKVINKEE